MLTDRYMLWIDGVGAWQLCVGSQFLIGGPMLQDKSADICLMANLSQRHASLLRNGEDWFIHPHNSTVVSGRAVTGPTLLQTGDEICMAERVRLLFRIPSVLAGSALLDFESSHRPAHSVNGIILMTDSILLGPRRDHHVCCPDWPELVVIYHQEGGLRCRSKAGLSINGVGVRDSAILSDGAIVCGDDFRFRIEKLKTS
ncbi:MAG: FHA domain-containing protein [Planctomycetota bacterium]